VTVRNSENEKTNLNKMVRERVKTKQFESVVLIDPKKQEDELATGFYLLVGKIQTQSLGCIHPYGP